jgi:small subunit ribosomal protein S6
MFSRKYTCNLLILALPWEEEPKKTRRRCKNTMNKYELCLVINAKIEEDARIETVERVKALIESLNGVITNVDEAGKKRLAYEIQKMREGYYYFIQFDASSDCPAEIERRVRIMEPVLRYLCVKQDA